MDIKVDRLIGDDFSFRYGEFYKFTKNELLSDGIRGSVNVSFDLIKGLHVLSKNESTGHTTEYNVDSIQKILDLTLFNHMHWSPSERHYDQLIKVSELLYKNKIPIFQDDEVEVLISASKNEKPILVKNNSIGGFTSEINELITALIKGKKLYFTIKLLKESAQRYNFEKFIFNAADNYENFFTKLKIGVLDSWLSWGKDLTLEQQLNPLAFLFDTKNSEYKDYYNDTLFKADQALIFYYFVKNMSDAKDLSLKIHHIGLRAKDKLGLYSHIATLMKEKSTFMMFNRPN